MFPVDKTIFNVFLNTQKPVIDFKNEIIEKCKEQLEDMYTDYPSRDFNLVVDNGVKEVWIQDEELCKTFEELVFTIEKYNKPIQIAPKYILEPGD